MPRSQVETRLDSSTLTRIRCIWYVSATKPHLRCLTRRLNFDLALVLTFIECNIYSIQSVVLEVSQSVKVDPDVQLTKAASWHKQVYFHLHHQLHSYFLEYKSRFLTKIFGSSRRGCYFLALTIFTLGIFRDFLYTEALSEQPFYPPLHQPLLGGVLFLIGNVLVLSSMYALGVTGTYLGDYFGILMDKKVEGFPFNVTSAPMYWGSTCSFVGTALYQGKPAGLLLSLQVCFMYLVALQFEE